MDERHLHVAVLGSCARRALTARVPRRARLDRGLAGQLEPARPATAAGPSSQTDGGRTRAAPAEADDAEAPWGAQRRGQDRAPPGPCTGGGGGGGGPRRRGGGGGGGPGGGGAGAPPAWRVTATRPPGRSVAATSCTSA